MRSMENLSMYLGITNQQFDVLNTIISLEEGGEIATPKNINKKYAYNYGKRIQNPNLFSILKELMEKNVVVRPSPADYRSNIKGIKQILQAKDGQMKKELKEFESVLEKTTEYFKKIADEGIAPFVKFLTYEPMHNSSAKKLSTATHYWSVTPFPYMSYTPTVASHIGIHDYLDVLIERGCKTKELPITYLTNLEIESPYLNALNFHKSKKKAYRATEATLDRLSNQIALYENLEVRFLERPFGLDINLMEQEDFSELFLAVRDENGLLKGGLYIKGPSISSAFLSDMKDRCQRAKRLHGEYAEEMISSAKERLKQKYGK